MFFVVSKLLAFLSSPIIWVFIILICSYFAKNDQKRKRLMLVAILSFYFFSNEFLFDVTFGKWEPRENKSVTIKNSVVYEAGIVLGGMTWYDEQIGQPQFLRSADRIYQAVWLLKKGKIKKLIISGGAGSLSTPHIKEASNLKRWLCQIGISDSLIIIENKSDNTHENAVYTKGILDSLRITNKPNLLITSASHLRRANACFVKQGVVHLTMYPTDYYSSKFRIEFDHCLIPNTDTFHAYTVIMHELIGYFVYKLMGFC